MALQTAATDCRLKIFKMSKRCFMKSKILSVALVFTLSLSLAACSKKNNDAANGNNAQNASNRRGMQFAQADLTGEVSKIEGNAITIKVVKMPQRQGNAGNPNSQDKGNPQTQGNQQGNAGDQAAQQNQNGQPNPSQQGTPNGTNAPGGQGGQGRQNGGGRAREYTGEERTITIPAGFKVTTMTRGDNGIEQTEVDLSTIKAGSLLQIYFKEDGTTLDRIVVNSQMGRGGFNGGNNGDSNGPRNSVE